MFKVNKLKISGFKSFAFPTDIIIADGVTGVIGPNGCGKSNIFEAIKWVMGESSSKSLRSDSMDDVIFNGTEKIPAKNFAEVSLEIELLKKSQNNNDNEKMSITRTLERGVGSFYKINNKEVRAKDIQILFSDSGSGSRSSSIIGQGNIEQIINFKPIDRKGILEEAAGTSGLFNRRHESELKLRATEQNLERLSDLLQALESQQKSLQRQARQASKYQIISDQIKDHQALILHKEWLEIDKKSFESKQKYDTSKDELELLNNKYKNHSDFKSKKNDEIKLLEKKIYNIENQVQIKELNKKNLLNKKILYKNRKEELSNYINLVFKDRQLEEKRSKEIKKNNLDILKKLENFTELNQLKSIIQNEKKKEVSLQEKLKLSESNLVTEMQLVLGEEFRLDNLKESKENFEEKFKKICLEIQETKLSLEKNSNIEYEKQSQILITKQKDFESLINVKKQKSILILSNKEKVNKERIAIVKEIEESQKLCTEYHTELSTLTKLSEKIEIPKNSIFNLIKIKKGYENAAYSILRNELDATLKDSKKRWSRIEKKIKSIDNSILPYVESPKELKLFLSQIMIVESEKEGFLKQKQLSVGQYIVSKSGTCWRWDGFVSEKDENNDILYTSKKRIEMLKSLISGIENKLKKQILKKNKFDRELNELNQSEQQNKFEIEKTFKKQNETYQKIQELKDKGFEKKNNFEKLSEKLKFLKNERDLIKIELEKIRSSAEIKNKKTCKEDANKSSTEELIKKIKEEIQTTRKHISQLHEKILNLEINFKFLKNDLEQNKKREIECYQQIKNLNLREENYKKEEKKLLNFPIELDQNLDLLEKQLINLTNEKENLKKKINLKKDEFKHIQENEDKFLNKKDLLKVAMIRSEENIIHLNEKKKDLIDITFQQLKCHPDEILNNMNLKKNDSIKIEDIKNNLEKLKFQREQMGPVNLRAGIEENEITKKLEELLIEKNDLCDAIQKLKLAINKINTEGKKKLLEAFTKVNKNFSELFVKLFEGGQASLKLVSSDDPLKTGLEIFAKPPGKKLTNISLLSGGEKTLTAISLIFSIFLINPSPICILDEVDAALDDVNVDKFCSLLKEIKSSSMTKFLIISHHKTTMAMVDRVYGVTMGQKGISDIVSVNFNTPQFKEAI